MSMEIDYFDDVISLDSVSDDEEFHAALDRNRTLCNISLATPTRKTAVVEGDVINFAAPTSSFRRLKRSVDEPTGITEGTIINSAAPAAAFRRLRRSIVDTDEEIEDILQDVLGDDYVPSYEPTDADRDFVVDDASECSDELNHTYMDDVVVTMRTVDQQEMARLETTFGTKYSATAVYSFPTYLDGVNNDVLVEAGVEAYSMYDKTKIVGGLMTDEVMQRRNENMQYYITAAYCYHHANFHGRQKIAAVADASQPGYRLETVYEILINHPIAMHFPGVSPSKLIELYN